MVAIGDDGRGGPRREEIPNGDRRVVEALQDGRVGVLGRLSTLHQSARHVNDRSMMILRFAARRRAFEKLADDRGSSSLPWDDMGCVRVSYSKQDNFNKIVLPRTEYSFVTYLMEYAFTFTFPSREFPPS